MLVTHAYELCVSVYAFYIEFGAYVGRHHVPGALGSRSGASVPVSRALNVLPYCRVFATVYEIDTDVPLVEL